MRDYQAEQIMKDPDAPIPDNVRVMKEEDLDSFWDTFCLGVAGIPNPREKVGNLSIPIGRAGLILSQKVSGRKQNKRLTALVL
ncbi:unnamed protein product [Timema podura]|uniref:Uncharacterized protein n=1 Tax=Timema podura TaxID=61482 RepID=A0ABN7PM60_TIMPD|nr:unnamed protein product [Timema podura]